MRLLILGASGFIGTQLAEAAISAGFELVTASRKGLPVAGESKACRWSFGTPLPLAACVDVDCAIHLGHDFNGDEGARLTIESTLAAAAQLRDAGTKRQVFFSSYSAGPHATSLYGRTKTVLEHEFAACGDMVIVRPGLVIGDGGVYGRIRKWSRILPVIPLPGGGRGRVPVIDVSKLCALTLDLARMDSVPAQANLFETELKSLRELVLEAALEVGRRPLVLPIPALLLTLPLRLAAWLRIPLPVNADNVDGFLSNQSATHASTLYRIPDENN